jgi:hypothetical protein
MGERINRLFDTVNESQDAFLDAVRSSNERTYRFSKIVIEEAGRTQREQAELAKQWMEAPLDPIGLTKSAMDTFTRRQRRRFELGRQLISDIATIRDETREVVERVVDANREALVVGVDAGRDAAREAASRAGDVARETAARAGDVARDTAARAGDVAARAGREVSDRLEDASETVDDAARSVRANTRRRSNGN